MRWGAVLALTAGFCLSSGEETRARSVEGLTLEPGREIQEKRYGDVTVEGRSLKGLTRREAKEILLEGVDWDMKAVFGGRELPLRNLMEIRVEALLQEADLGKNRPNIGNLMGLAREEAGRIAGKWNIPPKEPALTGYDREKGTFFFTGGVRGMEIREEDLTRELFRALKAKDYRAVLKATGVKKAPELKREELEERYEVLAVFETWVAYDGNRNQNISLAAEALNGLIIEPGEEFSFNEATGRRSPEKGYLPATAYLNGEVVQETGGGVCQVSSTLYNAVILSGLKSKERHSHTFEPSYVNPGEDATVSYGGPDFKFLNNSGYPVGILADFSDGVLTTSLYGVPVLKEGEEVRMDSYRADGKTWVTDLVRYQNGEEVSRERFHMSVYK